MLSNNALPALPDNTKNGYEGGSGKDVLYSVLAAHVQEAKSGTGNIARSKPREKQSASNTQKFHDEVI